MSRNGWLAKDEAAAAAMPADSGEFEHAVVAALEVPALIAVTAAAVDDEEEDDEVLGCSEEPEEDFAGAPSPSRQVTVVVGDF